MKFDCNLQTSGALHETMLLVVVYFSISRFMLISCLLNIDKTILNSYMAFVHKWINI